MFKKVTRLVSSRMEEIQLFAGVGLGVAYLAYVLAFVVSRV